MTKQEELIQIFCKFADIDGIPNIIKNDWDDLNKKYTKIEIKEAFAEYISRYSVMYPFRKISYDDVVKKFNDLKNKQFLTFIHKNEDEIIEKYSDYKYPYSKHGKFTISFGHYHNDVSNYFQQRNRYDCSSYSFVSPNEYWYSPDLLTKMNWTFWRLDNRGINKDKIRGSFRLGAYVATQFKPHVAKTIYDFCLQLNNSSTKTILDFSMGWGDRLAGFYASSGMKYIGIDPNPNVFRVYMEQCYEYEFLLSGERPNLKKFQIERNNNIYDAFHIIGASGKEVIAYNAPAEDMLDIIESEKYDCIFTSPPYFSTELYDEGGDDWKQSWFRYQKYENWWSKFYKPVITSCYNSLSENGIMMINIMDPKINGTRYKTCDQMVDHIVSIGGKFDGQVGMRIKQRPKKIDDKTKLNKHLTNTFIENIWCFSKKGFDITIKYNTLESLFGE